MGVIIKMSKFISWSWRFIDRRNWRIRSTT